MPWHDLFVFIMFNFTFWLSDDVFYESSLFSPSLFLFHQESGEQGRGCTT